MIKKEEKIMNNPYKFKTWSILIPKNFPTQADQSEMLELTNDITKLDLFDHYDEHIQLQFYSKDSAIEFTLYWLDNIACYSSTIAEDISNKLDWNNNWELAELFPKGEAKIYSIIE